MSEKKKQAQLRGLLGDLGGPAPRVEPESKPTQPKPAKKAKKDEQIQISAYIPKTLHRRVKVELASRDQTLTEVLIELLSKWAK